MNDWLAAQARAKPGGMALTFRGQCWRYRELHEAVNEWCARLAGLGLKPGGILATHLPNMPEHVMLVLAAARLGLVLAPLNTRLTVAELAAQLMHLKPAILICEGDVMRNALVSYARIAVTSASFAPGGANSSAAREEFAPPGANPFGLDAVQAIVFTSGSTGLPKGVELTFGNHFYSAVASASRLGTLPDDCWLSCLPLYHVGGLAIIFRACLYGITVALHERFDLDAINHALDTQPITLISLVPTMLKRLLETRTTFPATLRLVLLGGAAADESLLQACVQRGIPIAPTYGLTEAASQVTTLAPQDVAHKLGGVGKPLLFSQVRIVNDAGATAPRNEIGEVLVRGPTVMRGYFNNPAATAHAITQDNELRTGDLGYLDDDGDLFIVQRRSDLIVSGGENIFPAEVERALRQHPAVSEAFVMGLPDAEWGQRVAALIVLHEGAAVTEDALIADARLRLAGYKLPRLVRFVPSLPLLANGKIDRGAAQKLLES